MVYFCTFEPDGQDTVFDVDVHVRMQVLVYSYFDMRSGFRLLVVEVDHSVEFDGIEVVDRYFLG